MSNTRLIRNLALCGVSMASMLFYSNALSNPKEGNVVAGDATISSSGKKLDVHQNSNSAIIDWSSFDIDVDEHTQFHQPSSSATALNRVKGHDPSNILGKLTANGNVILINPNGVFFGKNAVIDVNGIIATTADINNDDFMAGKLEFNIPGNPDAAIINEGLITAKEAGLVGLVAPNVHNSGIITARLGKVQLASGDTFALDLYGDGLYSIAVSEDVASQLVHNTGEITAEGGIIDITAAAAREIVNSLIFIEGELKAPTVEQKNGKIIISGGDDVKITDAVIDASGYDDGENGGKIEITGNDIDIANSLIDASGNQSGGDIKIGGDYLGQGETPTAQTVTIDSDTTIKNDAIKSGDGGRTIIWSDNTTKFGGTATAKGGAEGGDGGFIETSGKIYLKIGNFAKVNTLAEFGKTGKWLLDPQDFYIQSSGGDISGATLSSNLGSSDITILSSGGGTSGSGNINVNDTVSWSANTLTLTAAKDININNVMTATGTAALTMNTATTNGGDAGVSGGRVKVDLDSDGFNGRVDYSSSGNLTINGNVHTVINSLGAQGSVTGTDLQGMAGNLSGYYVLGSNIDASATSGWNAGAGFDPIGTFTGEFNGLGHTISGLYIGLSTTNDIGLFSRTNGSDISNIGLLNVDIEGQNYVAGIVGNPNNTTFSSSYVTGDVTGRDRVAGISGSLSGTGKIQDSFANISISHNVDRFHYGGITGVNSGTIINSYSMGTISGHNWSGGLVGTNTHGASIINSYSLANVTSGGGFVGGLVGMNQVSASITDSYATGSVSGSNHVGGLLGGNNTSATVSNSYATGSVSGGGTNGGLVASGTSTSITNSFWNTQTTGQSTSLGGTGKTTAQMQNINTFTDAGWDFDDDWAMHPTENNSYPVLRNFFTELDVTLLKSTSKTYGNANPTLTLGTEYSVAGCAGCLSLDFGSAMTSSTGAGSYNYGNGSTVGTTNLFDHSFITGTIADYIVDYNYGSGSLKTTVKKATLTTSLENDVIVRSEKINNFDLQFSGFKLGEGEAVLNSLPNIRLSTNSSTTLEAYDILLSGGVDDNYTFSFNTPVGLLKIIPKSIDNVVAIVKSTFLSHSNAYNFNTKLDVNAPRIIANVGQKPVTILGGLVEIPHELATKFSIETDESD